MDVIQRFLDWLKPDWTESRIYGDQDDPDEIEEDDDGCGSAARRVKITRC